MDTKKIALYARVSTARQEEEQTIKTQIAVLKEFATSNNLSIVEEYTDEGWSGDVLARPSLDMLRADAKTSKWSAVLIYDPDRLARRYSYQELVMDELKEAGKEVMFITVAAPKNSEDKILYGVRGLFAEYERTKISERFRLGKLRKIKEGTVIISEAPYGYTCIHKSGNQPGHYIVNEEEATVVRAIFTWVAEDKLTLRKIVRKLQELGIKPRKSARGVWSTSTLSHLLRNKSYIGRARWNSSTSIVPVNPKKIEKYKKQKKTSRIIKPEEEWLTIPVPAILNEDLFFKAEKQRQENFKLCIRNTKNEYLLAGRIYCECGRTRSGEGPQNGKFLYYRCSDRVSSYPLKPTCIRKSSNAREVDEMVWLKLKELMSSPALMSKQLQRLKDKSVERVDTESKDCTALKKEIAKFRKQQDRYNEAYGSGVFSLEQLKEYVEPIKAKILSLEALEEKNNLDGKEKQVLYPDNESIGDFSAAMLHALENLNFQSKRAIVLSVVEKVIATKEQLTVIGNLPIPRNVEYKTINRNRLDTNEHSPIPFKLRITIPKA